MSTFTIGRGESGSWTFLVTNPDKTIPDLTNAKLWFDIKRRVEDDVPLYQKRSTAVGGSSAQIEILTQSGTTKGKARIKITAAETLALKPGTYWCDGFYEDSNGDRHKIIPTQEFIIEPSVTVQYPTT